MKKRSTTIAAGLMAGAIILLLSCGCATTASTADQAEARASQPAPETSRSPRADRTSTAHGNLQEVPSTLRRAHRAFQQRYYNEAVLRFREVETEYKQYADEAADRLADCYLYIGDRKKAIEAYRRAFKKYRSKYADKMLKRIKAGEI